MHSKDRNFFDRISFDPERELDFEALDGIGYLPDFPFEEERDFTEDEKGWDIGEPGLDDDFLSDYFDEGEVD